MNMPQRWSALLNRTTGQRRRLFFVAGDVVLLLLAIAVAAWLRFDGRVPDQVSRQLSLVAALSLLARLPAFASQRMYVMSWSQVSLDELVAVFRGVTLGTAVFWVLVFALMRTPVLTGFPRAVLLIEYFLVLHVVGTFRVAKRVYSYVLRTRKSGRPALIVGAGAAGEQLARSLRQTPQSGYAPVGFIDDDSGKIGTVIQGLRVLGDRQRLPAVVEQRAIDAVLVAMPSARSQVIRNVVSLAREAGVREIRIVPSLDRILNGQISFTDLREVQLADLLGREVARIESGEVARWLQGRTVLVTGAGGSIGAEMCRQLAQFETRRVVLLDWDESGLFWTERELQRHGLRTVTVLADVRDATRMREVLTEFRPEIVFHAAAYKHVGLMERHPEDAVLTNLGGTLSVARMSVETGVGKFVLISTDKAVNPTSVMGVTKRVAEQAVLALNAASTTRFLAVRFGNVLGSRGSVVPLFEENIRRGEAITIRGPNMRRYFMATSEAVLLVLQAGYMGQSGEVFVLDMGEPIRIIDLAREMIRLSGLEPDKDVPIVFGEPEPGEKEHEDLLTAEEGTVATRHDRIFAARHTAPHQPEAILARADELVAMARAHDLRGMVQLFRMLVPTYQPSPLLLSRVESLTTPR